MNRIWDPRWRENLSTIGQLDYRVCRWKRAISEICNAFYILFSTKVGVQQSVLCLKKNCSIFSFVRKAVVEQLIRTGNEPYHLSFQPEIRGIWWTWFHKLSSDNPSIPVRTEREEFVTYSHCILIT